MTTIVKAADAAHFLSLIPAMLGFTPRRSLVLVPFHGVRSIGGLRLDLPRDDTDLDAFAGTCLGMICRIPDADAFAAAIFSDDACADGLPGAELVAALRRGADACGVRVTDALSVGSDGWGSHLDSDCPPGGRPLGALTPVQVSDPPAAGDQASGAELPVVDAARVAAVGDALPALLAALDGLRVPVGPPRGTGGNRPRIHPEALAVAERLDDIVDVFEQALATDAPTASPFLAALLVWCLSRPALRDVAIVQWSADARRGHRALQSQQRWEEGEDYPLDLARTMWGDGPRPDPERLTRALTLTRDVAALAPEPFRPGALATCAWLSWALGRSTHAERYALLALDIEPTHGLAEIVLTFVNAGHLPDWAFRRP